MKKRGFTLLEVLIAASIFSIVGMLATSIFVNLNQNRQKITSRNLLYDDAQFILDSLSRYISSNTIDYEEYYNQTVLGGKPGMNFGHYAARFYYHLAQPAGGNNYTSCIDLKNPADAKKSCVNTGKHPSSGNFPDSANAFYRSGNVLGADAGNIHCNTTTFPPYFTSTKYFACVKRLFLINSDASRKTMIAPERISWEGSNFSHVLSQATLRSFETTANGVITSVPRVFTCEQNCSSNPDADIAVINTQNVLTILKNQILLPSNEHLDDPNDSVAQAYDDDFTPFTPSRVNIKDLKFFISPVEDPHRAFAEANDNNGTKTNIHQPVVTIVLTIEPISNVRYGTTYPALTVQTTVTPGLFTEIPSYPPQMKSQP